MTNSEGGCFENSEHRNISGPRGRGPYSGEVSEDCRKLYEWSFIICIYHQTLPIQLRREHAKYVNNSKCKTRKEENT
jgi:hypothetical protein